MKTYLIAFLDLLLCMLMVVLLMVHPKSDADLLKPPGNLIVYTSWMSGGIKNDVDTWMLSPKMDKPIGYDNKDSKTCNLVKDDLGYQGGLPNNYENIFCRDVPDGEYIIDVFAFECQTLPMTVNVQVLMIDNGVTKLLFEEKVTLTSPKDEKTVIRFKMKDGKLVEGSVNHVFVSLFEMK